MPEPPGKPAARLLVVEDDPAMLIALRDILETSGYVVFAAPNGQVALEIMSRERPNLILSDISMPIMDGIELFDSVRRIPDAATIPFIFLTARGTREDIFAAKSLGADDYITKPITSQELLAAVRARLQRTDELLLAQLKAAYKASLRALANAIESRDHYTRYHVERVNAYAQAVARELGWSDDRLETLEFGAILHDIGKISIPESILRKTGPLSKEEWAEMREHPRVGARMIEDIPYLVPAVGTIRAHHERWDGSGYPEGMREMSIPEPARLLAIVDAFDAMTSDRPYHAAVTAAQAHAEITSQSGRLFDPGMVEAFNRCFDRGDILQVLKTYQSLDTGQGYPLGVTQPTRDPRTFSAWQEAASLPPWARLVARIRCDLTSLSVQFKARESATLRGRQRLAIVKLSTRDEHLRRWLARCAPQTIVLPARTALPWRRGSARPGVPGVGTPNPG